MVSTRLKPEQTLDVLEQGLATLAQQLNDQEKKEQAFLDFNTLNNRLRAARTASITKRGDYLRQAKKITGRYFNKANKLNSTVPTTPVTLKVLQVYAKYAEAWRYVAEVDLPYIPIPDYATRALDIKKFIRANKMKPKAVTVAAHTEHSGGERRQSLSR